MRGIGFEQRHEVVFRAVLIAQTIAGAGAHLVGVRQKPLRIGRPARGENGDRTIESRNGLLVLERVEMTPRFGHLHLDIGHVVVLRDGGRRTRKDAGQQHRAADEESSRSH